MAFFGVARDMAQQLGEQLESAFPPALEPMTGRKSLDLRQKAIQQLLGNAVALQSTHKLGLLGRVIFARAFQGHLNRTGYSSAFIRAITGEVLAKITFAKS